jgi:hypothetical protein
MALDGKGAIGEVYFLPIWLANYQRQWEKSNLSPILRTYLVGTGCSPR